MMLSPPITRDFAKGNINQKLHVTGITDAEGSFGIGVLNGSRFGKEIKLQ